MKIAAQRFLPPCVRVCVCAPAREVPSRARVYLRLCVRACAVFREEEEAEGEEEAKKVARILAGKTFRRSKEAKIKC